VMGKRERDAGARFEREMARRLGVRRHLRPDWSESAPDIITDRLIVECKYRAGIAAVRFLEQVEQHADGERIPVVFARERRGRPVAILRLEDFLELVGGGNEGREEVVDG